jgi:hypothetical protein
MLYLSGRRAGTVDGEPHIPTFARSMLEELSDIGLLHRMDNDPPSNARRVKMEKDQDVWVRFDTNRDPTEGYKVVKVVDAPRSDAAILAAMIAWLAPEPPVFDEIVKAIEFIPTYLDVSARTEATSQRIREGEDVTLEEIQCLLRDMLDYKDKAQPAEHLWYIFPLLEYYRPQFKGCSGQEWWDLVKKFCDYAKDFLESLRKLKAFLEYGLPEGKLVPAIKNPQRDVEAAVLKDVHDLTHPHIGELLGMPPSDADQIKGYAQAASDAIERGRRILEGAFAEDGGWKKKAESMRADREWWQSLTEEERDEQYFTHLDTLASDGYLGGLP